MFNYLSLRAFRFLWIIFLLQFILVIPPYYRRGNQNFPYGFI